MDPIYTWQLVLDHQEQVIGTISASAFQLMRREHDLYPPFSSPLLDTQTHRLCPLLLDTNE